MLKIFRFINFNFCKENFIAIFVLVLSLIYIIVFNVDEVLKNSWFENLGIIPLVVSFFLCFKAKKYKVFYRTLAMVMLLLIAREINYGRVIFCQFPDNPHEFYSWSHYKYGWLVDVVIGLYIAAFSLWALLNKIWVDIFNMLKHIKIPFWTFLFSFIALFVQIYAERVLDSSTIEETAELTLYCLVVGIILIYLKKS